MLRSQFWQNFFKAIKHIVNSKGMDKSNTERLTGIITYKTEKENNEGYGYVKSADVSYVFRQKYVIPELWCNLREGVEISFEGKTAGNGSSLYATNIEILNIPVANCKTVSETITEKKLFYDEWLQQFYEVFSAGIPAYNEFICPDDFEKLVLTIFKLLGINDIYVFPRESQAGKADGFFKIGNLIVIYDCTLKRDYQNQKKWQIENFVQQLSGSKIEYKERIDGKNIEQSIDLEGKEKQCWIITRGQHREDDKKRIGKVRIKEVTLDKLLALLETRLSQKYFDEEDLTKALENL